MVKKKPTVEIVEHDPKKVNAAVEWINNKLQESVHKARLEIGQYVLQHFFDADVAVFQSQNPHKNESMRALADRYEKEELLISYSALHRCVSLAVQEVVMLKESEHYQQLPYSHKAELLPLRDIKKKGKLAAEVVEGSLSVRALRERVRRTRKKEIGKTTRGRPPKNSVMFLLDHVEKALESREIDDEDYAQLKEEWDMDGVADRAEELLGRLQVVVSAIRRRKPRGKRTEE